MSTNKRASAFDQQASKKKGTEASISIQLPNNNSSTRITERILLTTSQSEPRATLSDNNTSSLDDCHRIRDVTRRSSIISHPTTSNDELYNESRSPLINHQPPSIDNETTIVTNHSSTNSHQSRATITPPPNYHEIPGVVPSYQGRTSGPPPSYDEVVNPNAPPPTYNSLFGQVTEARKTSNGLVDLIRQLFLILIGTLGCTMIIGFLLIIPVTMILVGFIYLNECRAENIPSFLVIGGLVWIIKNVLNCYNQFKKDSSTVNRPPPRRTPISANSNRNPNQNSSIANNNYNNNQPNEIVDSSSTSIVIVSNNSNNNNNNNFVDVNNSYDDITATTLLQNGQIDNNNTQNSTITTTTSTSATNSEDSSRNNVNNIVFPAQVPRPNNNNDNINQQANIVRSHSISHTNTSSSSSTTAMTIVRNNNGHLQSNNSHNTIHSHSNHNRIRQPSLIGITSFRCESMLNYFLIVWFLAGCIIVYRIYEPDYTNPTSNTYCHRTVYLYAFWLMTSAFMIVAIVLSCFCCLMVSSLVSCNQNR